MSQIFLTSHFKNLSFLYYFRNQAEFLVSHFHGIKSTVRGFVGQNQTFCPVCGIYYFYTRDGHMCQNVKSDMCEVCNRAKVSLDVFQALTAATKQLYCQPTQEADSKLFQCSVCKLKANNRLCYTLHKRYKCENVVRCFKCQRKIMRRGKYSILKRQKPLKCHDNCDESFCTVCQDYVLGFDDDLENPTHHCFVKPIKKAKTWPSRLAFYDFETYPVGDKGVMRVNHAHLITQAESGDPASAFVGIFFSEIPMPQGVQLNGQTVRAGQEYEPKVDPKLNDYFPLEIVKAVPVEEPQKVSRGSGLQEDDFDENEPYDNLMALLLRHSHLAEPVETDPLPPHVDNYDQYLTILAGQKNRGSSETRCEEYLHYVDRAFLLHDQPSEEELVAQERLAEKRYLLQGPSSKKKNKKKNPFILEEAQVDDLNDFDELEEGAPENEGTLFFTADIHKFFLSKPEGGMVPGQNFLKPDPPDQIIANLSDSSVFENAMADCQIKVSAEPTGCLDYICEHEDPCDLEFRNQVFDVCKERDPSALRQFATYILQPKFKNTVFLAHYGSGFDHHFLFMELHKMGVRLDTIFKGNKLISFTIPALNIRFIDFFCFVPTSLKNLEKSFNLTTGSKGFFPHLLNKPEYFGLSLPHLPPKKFYEPDLMKTKDSEEFEVWYKESFDERFSLADQMTYYCETDVLILLSACLSFVRETLVQQTEFQGKVRDLEPNDTSFWLLNTQGEKIKVQPGLVHPFSKDVATLSTYANVLFRSYYLVENQLPIITHNLSETFSDRSSREEAEYLMYIKHMQNVADLEFGAAHLRQRKFTVLCPDTLKTHSYYVDGYSPGTKVSISLKLTLFPVLEIKLMSGTRFELLFIF